jgi:predicted NACHT family NTPase
LAADVTRFLDNEPVLARPPSQIYQLQKFVRRNRTTATAAAAVLLSLAFGLVISSLEAVRAWRASGLADAQRRVAQTERDKAQHAEQAEKLQRERAQASERAAQRDLYIANMNLVQQAWDQNNVERARQLLADKAGDPERGFEWFYWQRQLHQEIRSLRGHVRAVTSVAVSPDGKRILTGSMDRTAKVWDALEGKELFTLFGHAQWIWAVAFSPDGQRLATGSRDGTAMIWDAANGDLLLTCKGHSSEVSAVAFSPDSRRVLTGSSDRTARVWDATTGRELMTFSGSGSPLQAVAFSPDGRRVVTAFAEATGTQR